MIDGAAVRVSLVCFSRADDESGARLDGQPVDEIYTDLTAGRAGVDLTGVRCLPSNAGVAFHERHEGWSARRRWRPSARVAPSSGESERPDQPRHAEDLAEGPSSPDLVAC